MVDIFAFIFVCVCSLKKQDAMVCLNNLTHLIQIFFARFLNISYHKFIIINTCDFLDQFFVRNFRVRESMEKL